MGQYFRAFAAAALALTLSLPALANVSLKNGNFFMGYTDIVYPGGFEPKIERIYNSKTVFEGMFGKGWGTEYEARLIPQPDGSVLVKEYGGGAENLFTPKGQKRADIKAAAKRIADAARKKGMISSTAGYRDFLRKLMNDASFRNEKWEELTRSGALKFSHLKEGTQLTSNRFSFQYITKVKNGYKRTFDSGKTETFDNAGRLVEMRDRNNNWIKLSYGKDGHLSKIVDSFNRRMTFKFNRQGLVERITGKDGKTAQYRYDGKRRLTWTKDTAGNIYEYGYDQRFNMTSIKYQDGTSMKMAYYPPEKFDNIKMVKDRDGTVTEYGYKFDPSNKDHFWINVKVKDKKGKVISKNGYEYVQKTKKTGEKWTYKLVTNLDGARTETIYNECCGLPIMIKKGNRTTNFKYDNRGRVSEKNTPTELTKLKYHRTFGKVTRVDKYSKISKKKVWSTFEYDGRGNLKFAKNSDKRGVRLFYDKRGRIKSMVDQGRRRIDFKYNENSKPIEIRDPKLGAIKVSYKSSGEIKKVESTAGRKIALQVTSAFQNLLDIIRPAGVSLSF